MFTLIWAFAYLFSSFPGLVSLYFFGRNPTNQQARTSPSLRATGSQNESQITHYSPERLRYCRRVQLCCLPDRKPPHIRRSTHTGIPGVEAARSATVAKSRFLATVSHELRTPLASIRLLAETLEMRTSGSPEVRDYPARIIQAADGLHFLVENILSFNRIDKGRWVPQFSQVKLEELIGTLRSDLATAARVPVELHSDVGDTELQADPSLLRLLLSNLGRNACAYNHRSPVEISVRVHAPPGLGCTVLFADNGIGIPESEWEHVFLDFYRLTQAGPEVHGSGLGLALCRRIMHVHGGQIRVAASSPQGTTFALTFPEPRR